jgi:transcriptional regulator with XRE-family HTH domain
MNNISTSTELEAMLGSGIRSARLRKNITQMELASMADVALGSVKNLENGQGATVATLVRVVRALQLQSWIESLQPAVSISPMQMLKAKQPRQRARVRKDDGGH